ncbi:hypothetical protein RY831_26830 [Noviherbaspirillum sp. CPCC 100848]|uniref:Lipoprotein n=2 Tax=Noviherbaspirillum album TaxID=3080276 RepID=A0ABU6JGI6_9BURK|nr:hypothetical protein [Noviherbaspirillum sp. CPCC 100848]
MMAETTKGFSDRQFWMAGLVTMFLMTACSVESPAERQGRAIVNKVFPGQDIRATVVSKDGDYFCGEVGTANTGYRKFWTRWVAGGISYEGGNFSARVFTENCGVAMTDEELNIAQTHADNVARADAQQSSADRAERQRQKWLKENEKALRALSGTEN